jgi:hypothetical protein
VAAGVVGVGQGQDVQRVDEAARTGKAAVAAGEASAAVGQVFRGGADRLCANRRAEVRLADAVPVGPVAASDDAQQAPYKVLQGGRVEVREGEVVG